MSYRTILVVGIACLAAACRAETYSDSTIPSGLQVVHGPPTLVSLGTEMDTLLQVRVVDANGDPVGGVPVTWRITAGDGQLLPTGDSSGADGLAVARWKFGMIPGPKQVQVQIPGVDPLTLSTEAHGFRAVQVTAGYTHGCALDAGGSAWCWNADSVVRGAPGEYNDIRPTRVGGGHQFTEISAGDSYTCALTVTGEVWCWGHAYGGSFGPALATDQPAPVQIAGLPPIRRVRSGEEHSCGIAVADSTTWCWGSSGSGQAGAVAASVDPTQISTPLKFVDLALGSDHSCGLTASHDVYCWGAEGSLGDSVFSSRSGPTVPVAGGHAFAEIKAGDLNTCGRTTGSEVWCWGGGGRPTPVQLDLPPATSLAVGFDFVGITTLGGGARFVQNSVYELPVPLRDLGVAQLAGRGSYCLISRTGEVYCSGSIVDQGSCSAVAPEGCADPGPIPLPTGGRVYGYPPFGD